ncbi:MAG: extracellular solute-binding protein [Treponema sp.]|nr:extracellular solute-binding protein [Treponema sp.]
MKRKILLTMVVFLMVFSFLACDRDNPSGRAATGAYQVRDPNLTPPGTFPIVREPITLSVGLPVHIQVSDYYDNMLTKYFENLLGINLEFAFYDPGNDGLTRLNLQVASGEPLPDLLYFKGPLGNQARREAFGRAGAIIPLNDLIEHQGVHTRRAIAQIQSFDYMGIDPWFWGMDSEGVIWGYMLYEQQFSNANSARAVYNTEFAAALGMDESQWQGGASAGHRGRIPHWDWFLAYLRGIRDNDVNGNGIMNDEVPLAGSTGWHAHLLGWLQKLHIYSDYTSTYSFWMVQNDQLQYTYDKPEYRDALRTMNMLYRERLWDESSLTQGNLTALNGGEWPVIGVGTGGGGAGRPFPGSLTYMPMGVVEGPTGVALNSYWLHTPVFPWVISSNSQYPEAAFRFLDAQGYDDDFAIYPRFGFEGHHWRRSLPHEPGLYGTMGPNIGPVHPYMTEVVVTWGDNQNVHWRDEFGIDFLNRKASMAWDGDEANGEYRLGLNVQQIFPFTPAEFPIHVVYTSAENERWDQTRVEVLNYVTQSRALFATGQMDVEREWDSYLDTLRRMGANDLLAVDQAAYARLRAATTRMWGPPPSAGDR